MIAPLEDLNVLVVEDNKQAMKLMIMILKGLGVNQIYQASDGKEAQDFLGEADELVNFIICDWRMPRMTGLELLQQVRTTHPDMPFLMVAANTDIQSVKTARQFGVNAYIGKPYSTKQMEEKIVALAVQL